MLENRKTYAPEPPETEPTPEQSDPSVRLKALQDLTLALLKEVESLKEAAPREAAQTETERGDLNFAEEVRRFETDLIQRALVRTGGHQRRAARLLNIKVTTLNAKIKRYGIKPAAAASNVVDLYPESQRGIN